MKTFCIFFIFTFLNLFAISQSFYKGTIYFENGNTQSGFIKIPSKAGQKTISYKSTENGKVEKLINESVRDITVNITDSKTLTFHCTYIRILYKMGSSDKVRIIKKKGWLYQELTDPMMNCYIGGQEYKITKDKKLKIISSGLQVASTNYYFKRPGEREATFIAESVYGAVIINLEKTFRYVAGIYLKDSSLLINKIQNGELKSGQILEVYKFYIKK